MGSLAPDVLLKENKNQNNTHFHKIFFHYINEYKYSVKDTKQCQMGTAVNNRTYMTSSHFKGDV